MSIEKTEYLLEQINKLKNKGYEVAILAPLLVDVELNDVRPFTLYPVNHASGRYFIDLYYPELKLAIEIDELHHEKQKERDEERQETITKIEDCQFKRIKISNSLNIYETIKELKECILRRRNVNKKNNTFKEWTIVRHTMEEVQKEYPNAIFFKATKSNINNSYDPARGPIKISEMKRKEANLFVTYSGNTVINVYASRPENWREFLDKSLGYCQLGQEIPNHPLLSSGTTTQWTTTSNRIFGNNLIE